MIALYDLECYVQVAEQNVFQYSLTQGHYDFSVSSRAICLFSRIRPLCSMLDIFSSFANSMTLNFAKE